MGKDQELLEAARSGNFSIVEKILFQKAKRSGPLASLRRGPGANVQDSSGYSSLHHASLNGHKEIVEILLSNEASTNIVDVKGSSPLHLAAWSGNVDIVRMLLCHGPSIPNVNLLTKDNETALHCAAQYGHTEVVCLLLEHSCDPTIRNSRQETALDLAAQYGRLETVDMLVRTHAELIQPYNGRSSFTIFPHTPLHLASRNGHKSVVEVLLSGGMNVNVRTAAGTALHEAALCGKTEVVRTLLERGIDLSLKDSQNNTVTDILKQFPCHVVHDIYSIIKRYSRMIADNKDDSSTSFSTISINSPHDNGVNSTIDGLSPSSTSPMHYDLYERRNSGSCSVSLSSEGVYSRANYNVGLGAFPKSYTESNFLSDDLSYSRSRDFDSVSVCSTTSSNCSRDRRSPYPNNPNAQLSSPGSISNKISPTPPKKPPRRNLSISPTHISPQSISIAADQNGYDSFEYAFFKQNQKLNENDEFQTGTNNGPSKNRDALLRRGKSAEHYLDAKFRHSVVTTIDPNNDRQSTTAAVGTGGVVPMIRGKSEDLQLLDSKFQPISITSVCGNIPYRTTNPRRKLRRQNNEYNGENYDPSFIISRGDLPFKKVECRSKSPINIERILIASGDYRCHSVSVLKSSRENLLEEQKNILKKPLSACPLSPTHYQQPPTPDHPPPSAVQAENRIHDRIRPLSQEYSNLKRKSRDIETETEEELLLLVFPSTSLDVSASNGSICSSISLSDKSVSTDNNTVEEFIGDAPFAGLFKGSVNSSAEYEMSPLQKLERPKTLRQLKTVYSPKIESEQQQQPTNIAEIQGKNNNHSDQINGSKNLSILSPFDEQEEWAKISEIMASFGSSLVRESVFVAELEQEFQNRLGFSKKNDEPKFTISQWLTLSGFSEFEEAFVNFGYDNIDFVNGVLNDCDLKELGMINECDRDLLLQEANKLPNKVGEFWQISKDNDGTVDKKFSLADNDDLLKCWLDSLDLNCYADTFEKHMYNSLEKIRKLWEVELTAVLEITKPGHRRRILASIAVAKSQNTTPSKPQAANHLDDLSADLNQLKSNLQQLKKEIRNKIPVNNSVDTTNCAKNNNNNKRDDKADKCKNNNNDSGNTNNATITGGGGTLHRHNHKKSRPAPPPPVARSTTGANNEELEIRNPSELLIGVPPTLTTQWRHKPNVLLNGTVNYVASYLGSTVVKELRGTESTKKSIQKLKKSTSVVDCRLTPEIILAISYRGVKFLNVDNHSLICEHEIRNIHCACQDAEDLTHFAYITKDHASKTHYCHVFCVQTMDQATEVILTLGEAFEVAYQMALKEHFVVDNDGHRAAAGSSNVKPSGHVRSQSVNNVLDNSSVASSPSSHCATHSRSHSINNVIDSPPIARLNAVLLTTTNLTRSEVNGKTYSISNTTTNESNRITCTPSDGNDVNSLVPSADVDATAMV